MLERECLRLIFLVWDLGDRAGWGCYVGRADVGLLGCAWSGDWELELCGC